MAVYKSDINRVKSLLHQGADPNHQLYLSTEWWCRSQEKQLVRLPPLHTACKNGSLEIVKMLFQFGAKVEMGDGNTTKSPLHYACEAGQKEVVLFLLTESGCKTGKLIH